MRIRELAARSGLTASRIRIYEQRGLISAVTRDANGYRDYMPEVLKRFRMQGVRSPAGDPEAPGHDPERPVPAF